MDKTLNDRKFEKMALGKNVTKPPFGKPRAVTKCTKGWDVGATG
jgi:hypothetical protein